MTGRYSAPGGSATIYRRNDDNPGGLYGQKGIRFCTVDADIERKDLVIQSLETGEDAVRAGPALYDLMQQLEADVAAGTAAPADVRSISDQLAAIIPSFKAPGP